MPPPGPSSRTLPPWSWDPEMRAGNLLAQPTRPNPTVPSSEFGSREFSVPTTCETVSTISSSMPIHGNATCLVVWWYQVSQCHSPERVFRLSSLTWESTGASEISRESLVQNVAGQHQSKKVIKQLPDSQFLFPTGRVRVLISYKNVSNLRMRFLTLIL